VSAGISDLLGKLFYCTAPSKPVLTPYTVLKTTESSFTNFIRDEFTTLVEVDDRIFSTAIDLNYTFAPIDIQSPTDQKKLDFVVPIQKGEKGYEGSVWDDGVPERARLATLNIFATDDSASVQVRLFFLGCYIFPLFCFIDPSFFLNF
jgi:urate oxidase